MKLLSEPSPRLQRKQSIYALHGPNAATELAMLTTVSALDPTSLPVLPTLLKKPSPQSAPPLEPNALPHTAQHQQSIHGSCSTGKPDVDARSGDQAAGLQAPQAAEGKQADTSLPCLDDDALKIASEFTLNPEQARVLHHCTQWASGNKVSMWVHVGHIMCIVGHPRHDAYIHLAETLLYICTCALF